MAHGTPAPEGTIRKADAITSVTAALREELAALEQVTRMAIDEATSGESKAENKWDTRGLESSYLAAGQGERVLSLRRLLGFFETEPAVSLVAVEGDEGPSWFLLVPDGGGRRVWVDGTPLVLVTPGSPVGQVLVGAVPGDEVRLVGREATVLSVA